MKFKYPLEKTKILRRYKRFFADLETSSGDILVAHVPNTGPMRGAWNEGWICYAMKKEKPKKLTHGAELTENPEGILIGINTQNPNKIIKEALIKDIKNYKEVIPEQKIGNSKFDFLLKNNDGSDSYLEVKNVSGEKEKIAFFPDTVSERALKHINELRDLNKKGIKTNLIFLIQRSDCSSFRPGDEYHPEYGIALREAIKEGVNVLAFSCDVSLTEIKLGKKIKINI